MNTMTDISLLRVKHSFTGCCEVSLTQNDSKYMHDVL